MNVNQWEVIFQGYSLYSLFIGWTYPLATDRLHQPSQPKLSQRLQRRQNKTRLQLGAFFQELLGGKVCIKDTKMFKKTRLTLLDKEYCSIMHIQLLSSIFFPILKQILRTKLAKKSHNLNSSDFFVLRSSLFFVQPFRLPSSRIPAFSVARRPGRCHLLLQPRLDRCSQDSPPRNSLCHLPCRFGLGIFRWERLVMVMMAMMGMTVMAFRCFWKMEVYKSFWKTGD